MPFLQKLKESKEALEQATAQLQKAFAMIKSTKQSELNNALQEASNATELLVQATANIQEVVNMAEPEKQSELAAACQELREKIKSLEQEAESLKKELVIAIAKSQRQQSHDSFFKPSNESNRPLLPAKRESNADNICRNVCVIS